MIDVANLLFFIRNGNRAQNGEGGRSFVTVAQGAKFFNQISQYDNAFARGTKSAIEAFDKISKGDKLFRGLQKSVDFASKNVNTLICVSSGINIYNAKDKQSAVIAEAGNLGGMFLIEGWMKKNLDSIINKLPISNKWKPIVRGIIFVCGSIGVSTLGYKVGKIMAEQLKKEQEKFSAKNVQQNFNAKSVSYAA